MNGKRTSSEFSAHDRHQALGYEQDFKRVKTIHLSSDELPLLPAISKDEERVVFTHPSVVPQKDMQALAMSYERLEFIGDAYIELMATRLICEKFENLPAGRLSQLREILVKNETLAEIAVKYGFDHKLAVAPAIRANAKQWGKIKGDVVEAYVAAIVASDEKMGGMGFSKAESWLRQMWSPKLEEHIERPLPNLKAKDELSRRVVSRNIKLEYLKERPMKHLAGGLQTHYIGVFLTGWGYTKLRLGRGDGLNTTIAGNRAAEDALQHKLIEDLAQKKRDFDEHNKRQLEEYQSAKGSTDAKQTPDVQEATMNGERKLLTAKEKRDMFTKKCE